MWTRFRFTTRGCLKSCAIYKVIFDTHFHTNETWKVTCPFSMSFHFKRWWASSSSQSRSTFHANIHDFSPCFSGRGWRCSDLGGLCLNDIERGVKSEQLVSDSRYPNVPAQALKRGVFHNLSHLRACKHLHTSVSVISKEWARVTVHGTGRHCCTETPS